MEKMSGQERNPNTIGERLGFSKDLLTTPDKVYRGVVGIDAIKDLEKHGIVRNKHSAGLTTSKWGDKVFWTKGREGKYTSVHKGSYLIEAPLSVAKKRTVTKQDITAIYTKNENGEVIDVLDKLFQK